MQVSDFVISAYIYGWDKLLDSNMVLIYENIVSL